LQLIFSGRSLTSHEVHDQRNHSEDDKQMNEQTAYMHDEESAQP
jgi:hypothetical protein